MNRKYDVIKKVISEHGNGIVTFYTRIIDDYHEAKPEEALACYLENHKGLKVSAMTYGNRSSRLIVAFEKIE